MSLTTLAADVLRHATFLDNYIANNSLPEPSFDANGPTDFPIPSSAGFKLQEARMSLLDASKAIFDLAAGPSAAIARPLLAHPYESLTLRALTRFNIPEAVPLDGEATFASIATETKLDEDFVTRILRYACTLRIFRETSKSPSTITHTAGSRALCENQLLRNFVITFLDDGFLATAAMVNEAVLKHRSIAEVNHHQTAFNIAFATNESYLSYVRRPEERQKLHALNGALKYIASASFGGRSNDPDILVNGPESFDWEAVGEGLVVDAGGGHGQVSASIARRYPKLRFVVQDLPPVTTEGEAVLATTTADAPETASRISFMAHDLLTPQPMLDADVFLFRFVLHDWSDAYAVKILQNLLPAMKQTTRIVIMDCILPAPNTVLKAVENLERSMDLSVMAIVAGKERSREDWVSLVEKTHRRLRIVKIHAPVGSTLGIIEIVFKDEEDGG